MTSASGLSITNRWQLRMTGSETYHRFGGCWHARTHEGDMEAVQLTQKVIDMIESPFSAAKLCRTCFGTDGKKTFAASRHERSRKVTIDTARAVSDDQHAITSDDPRKDHAMAPTATAPKPTESAPNAIPGPDLETAPAEPEWSLSNLAEPVRHADYKPAPDPAWDAIAGTPEAVRMRAEASLGHNAAAVTAAAAKTGKRARPAYRWDLQPVPGPEQGELFKKALEKYAYNRPRNATIPFRPVHAPDGRVTARCGTTEQFVKTSHGYVAYKEGMEGEPFWAVRYSVRPLEQRNSGRKPAASN